MSPQPRLGEDVGDADTGAGQMSVSVGSDSVLCASSLFPEEGEELCCDTDGNTHLGCLSPHSRLPEAARFKGP